MKTNTKLFTIVLLLASVAGGGFLAAQSTTTTVTTAPASTTGTTPPGLGRGRGDRGGGRQPHMETALLGLREARRQLELAVPDKGGNREKAIKSVDVAIADVNAGIEYARLHPEEFTGRGGRRGGQVAPPAGASTTPTVSNATSST